MFRAFRHRNYRLLFFGQAVSLTGSWMQTVAQAWLIYRLTEDPFLLGLVAFSSQFPHLIFGPWAGVTADRYPRRRLVVVTQSLACLQAALLAALTFSGVVEPWHVCVLAAFLGAVTAFDLPARQVLVGELVPPSERHNAIALHSAAVNGSRIVGPILAGVLVSVWGEGLCFAVNSMSFLAVIVALLWGIGLASHWLWVLAPDLRERWIAQDLARRAPRQPVYSERVLRELEALEQSIGRPSPRRG